MYAKNSPNLVQYEFFDNSDFFVFWSAEIDHNVHSSPLIQFDWINEILVIDG